MLLRVNNTVKAKLYLFYPGDEVLMIEDNYPYPDPVPIMIDPEIRFSWVEMTITARKMDWTLDRPYAGGFQNLKKHLIIALIDLLEND